MSEKRILTVKCPHCAITLQVKTRSSEKIVACPKCQTPVTVSSPADMSPQAEALSEAALWEEPQPAPFAEPLATTQAASARAAASQPAPMAIAIGVSAAVVLFGIGIFFAIRAGHPLPPFDAVVVSSDKPKSQGNSGQGTAKPSEQNTSGQDAESPVVPKNDAEVQKVVQPVQPIQQQDNAAKLAAKQELEFAQKAYQAAERVWEQRRNWRLANAGRLGAMGIKLVPEYQENEKLRRDLAKQAYDRARQMYLQAP